MHHLLRRQIKEHAPFAPEAVPDGRTPEPISANRPPTAAWLPYLQLTAAAIFFFAAAP